MDAIGGMTLNPCYILVSYAKVLSLLRKEVLDGILD
jgi:hypothetical protein